jgi:hypothetical protein
LIKECVELTTDVDVRLLFFRCNTAKLIFIKKRGPAAGYRDFEIMRRAIGTAIAAATRI